MCILLLWYFILKVSFNEICIMFFFCVILCHGSLQELLILSRCLRKMCNKKGTINQSVQWKLSYYFVSFCFFLCTVAQCCRVRGPLGPLNWLSHVMFWCQDTFAYFETFKNWGKNRLRGCCFWSRTSSDRKLVRSRAAMTRVEGT